MNDSRRVKIVFVDPRLMISILNWMYHPTGWYSLPVTDELPDGCEVLSVHCEEYRRAIAMKVCHPSFDVVADGALPPYVDGFQEIVYRRPKGSTELVKKDDWLKNEQLKGILRDWMNLRMSEMSEDHNCTSWGMSLHFNLWEDIERLPEEPPSGPGRGNKLDVERLKFARDLLGEWPVVHEFVPVEEFVPLYKKWRAEIDEYVSRRHGDTEKECVE